MAGIFLSYSREERACAERLARALEKAGHRVWWDRHLTSGREFAAEIEGQLDKADIVVVAWSKDAARSPWVRDEAAVGRDKGRLLPVVIDGSEPPIGFRQFQALDLTGWRGRPNDRRTKALVDAVDAILSGAAPIIPHSRKRFGLPTGRRLWAAAAALVLVVIAVGILLWRPSRSEAEPASLAVLPFKNLSSGDSYFAEGVAEEILSQLAREPQFKIVGRTSAALFKDAADVRDVGRRLHVAYVLEGSVRSAGKQVRVDVSLVDARKGMRLWSQDFRGSLDDIFAIQDSVGQQVAANLRKKLVTAAPRGSTTRRGDVYELALTARSLIRTREAAKLAVAVELLQRAVKLDPNYAPAWARLAQAIHMSRVYGHPDEPKTGWVTPEELRYAERALALAPDLAEAHAVMWLLLDSPNVSPGMKSRGRAELERAVKLDPTDAQNWYWLFILRGDNDFDLEGALVAARRAAEIDPFFTFNHYYGQLAWEMGERDAAMRFLKNWIQNHPDPSKRLAGLQWLADVRNDWSGLYKLLKKARDLSPADRRQSKDQGMGLILLRVGLVDQARRYLDPNHIAMRLGQAPAPNAFADEDPMNFWQDGPVPLVGRALINHGRAAELVSLYDRAFPTRDAMVNGMKKPQFVELAPVAAAALRAVGRNEDAQNLLASADRLCQSAKRRGRLPTSEQVNCSRSWAMLGRREDAIRTLDHALKLGWRPQSGWSYEFTDEPVYRAIRDDPRLKRMGQFVLAENAREKRELLAAGL